MILYLVKLELILYTKGIHRINIGKRNEAMRRRKYILILNFLIPLTLLIFSILSTSYDVSNYKENFIVNNIEDKTGKTLDQLEVITEDLLDYLKPFKKVNLSEHFNKREVDHMIDVRNIFMNLYILLGISLFIILALIIYLFKNSKLDLSFLEESLKFKYKLIWFFPVIVLIILSSLDFNKYFIYFHLIFFDNDLWLLDPRTDLMIQMLPQSFFITMFKKIVVKFFLIYILIDLSLRIKVRFKRRKQC